jgi:hypothetical protein
LLWNSFSIFILEVAGECGQLAGWLAFETETETESFDWLHIVFNRDPVAKLSILIIYSSQSAKLHRGERVTVKQEDRVSALNIVGVFDV